MRALIMFATVVFTAVLLAGCTTTSTTTTGTNTGQQDVEGPRQLVSAYMDALKTPDYAKALEIAGLPLPKQAADQITTATKSQTYFKWQVTGYVIKDVKVDGGLAQVTVEETSTRDVDPSVKSNLAALGEIGNAIKWGEIKTTETFVLVRLNGKWSFDNGHSGVPFASLPMDELGEAASKGQPPPSATQKRLADFINGIGLGQMVQTLTSPAVPLIAAIAVPNFARARGQGQATACKSNLKNIGTALEMYSTDSSGRYPTELSQLAPNYLKAIPTCAAAGSDTYSSGFASASSPDAYTVVCTGQHHGGIGYSAEYPQYTSVEGLRER